MISIQLWLYFIFLSWLIFFQFIDYINPRPWGRQNELLEKTLAVGSGGLCCRNPSSTLTSSVALGKLFNFLNIIIVSLPWLIRGRGSKPLNLQMHILAFITVIHFDYLSGIRMGLEFHRTRSRAQSCCHQLGDLEQTVSHKFCICQLKRS